jgi:hypothetical protein
MAIFGIGLRDGWSGIHVLRCCLTHGMSLRGTFPSLGDKLPEFFDHILLVVNPSPQFRGLRFEFGLDSLQLVVVVYCGSHESAF